MAVIFFPPELNFSVPYSFVQVTWVCITADMEAISPTAALCVLLAGGALFLLTRDAPATRDGDEREPPVLPFALPLVGHLIQFLWNTEKLLAKAS